MSVTIEIPAGGPLFEGHFPGRPILAGIAELALIARAVARSDGPASVRSIPFLRFRGLVMPGDTLEVAALPAGADGATRFEARRAGTLVANGAIAFGAPDPADEPGTAVASRTPRGVPPFDALIPHRPPMRFVERVLGEAEDGTTCLARVPHACALAEGGAVPAFVALEAAAQTAAIWEALRRAREGGGPSARIGYLVSARDVTLHRETLPTGVDLFVSIRLDAMAAPLTTYAVEVVTEGAVTLRGTIGTYLAA